MGVLKAYCLDTGTLLAPFGDPVGDCPLQRQSLREAQEAALSAQGLALVESPPEGEDYLLFTDRCWFTPEALGRFLREAEAPARVRVEDPTFLAVALPVGERDPGLFELALLPAGAPPSFEGLPDFVLDLDIAVRSAPEEHPALSHAMPESLPFTDAGLAQIEHWSELLRANWLAMSCTVAREMRRFQRLPWWTRAWKLLGLLLRTRTLNPWRLAAALSQRGVDCKVHPTAVVEASVLGDGVEVGPFCVIRGSVLGDGVRIEEHAIVNASVLGPGARIGRRGTANLCLYFPGAFTGAGNGFQASVFGRDCFVAWSVTVMDLSFGKPIRVNHRGQRCSTGSWFLGAAVGHRARLGAHVALGYGSEVPNDAFLVGPGEGILRHWEDGEGPHRVEDGVARPLGEESE